MEKVLFSEGKDGIAKEPCDRLTFSLSWDWSLGKVLTGIHVDSVCLFYLSTWSFSFGCIASRRQLYVIQITSSGFSIPNTFPNYQTQRKIDSHCNFLLGHFLLDIEHQTDSNVLFKLIIVFSYTQPRFKLPNTQKGMYISF